VRTIRTRSARRTPQAVAVMRAKPVPVPANARARKRLPLPSKPLPPGGWGGILRPGGRHVSCAAVRLITIPHRGSRLWFEDLQPCTYFPFIPTKLWPSDGSNAAKRTRRVGMPSRPAALDHPRWFFQRARRVNPTPANNAGDERAVYQRLRGVYQQLSLMLERPWATRRLRGFHECDLCRFKSEARGTANLFIPGNGVIYVCRR